MCTAFLCSDYYGPSAPSRHHQPTVDLPADQLAAGREGQHRDGSHVHHVPVDRIGAQLSPCSLANGYAAGIHRGLLTDINGRLRSRLTVRRFDAHCCPARIHQVGAGSTLEGDQSLVQSLRLSVSLAGPAPSGGADASRRCQGCFPPSPAPPGSGCPQLHRAAATARSGGSLTRRRIHGASWRTRTT
jgi:hypothetical protein